jgi:hypothetical protein
MMSGSVHDPFTWRTGLNAPSKKQVTRTRFLVRYGTGTYRASFDDGKIKCEKKERKWQLLEDPSPLGSALNSAIRIETYADPQKLMHVIS